MAGQPLSQRRISIARTQPTSSSAALTNQVAYRSSSSLAQQDQPLLIAQPGGASRQECFADGSQDPLPRGNQVTLNKANGKSATGAIWAQK